MTFLLVSWEEETQNLVSVVIKKNEEMSLLAFLSVYMEGFSPFTTRTKCLNDTNSKCLPSQIMAPGGESIQRGGGFCSTNAG